MPVLCLITKVIMWVVNCPNRDEIVTCLIYNFNGIKAYQKQKQFPNMLLFGGIFDYFGVISEKKDVFDM